MSGPAPARTMSRLDRWGMILSSVCLVHCLALPVAAALLPILALPAESHEWVHPLLIGLALPVTGTAMIRGWRAHRRRGPLLLGMVGLGMIGAAIFQHGTLAESALTLCGGLIVASAHVMNWRSHAPHP